jgi:hypothetical protein
MRHMADTGDEPSGSSTHETAMDRFVRFGTALFAVKKDELPKRNERAKSKRSRKTPKPAPEG